MADLSLQSEILKFYKMGFQSTAEPGNNPKTLLAVFYYVHDGQTVKMINDKLVKNGLRPATAKELLDFYNYHLLSLAHIGHCAFVATDPQSIEKNTEKNYSCLPSIWKEEKYNIKFGPTQFRNMAENIYIEDHYWYVLAIDEK